MSATNHPDYELELEKLNYVTEYVKNFNNRITLERARLDKEIDYGLTHYNSDNAEQFNELILNTTLMENIKQKLNSLERARSKPYFARVDFAEENIYKKSLYIGKMGVLRAEDNEPIVVDWRSPIANLYYEGRLGSARYYCPEGEINGEISLKRQYTIEAAKLQEIYDIDITTNDDFLQASLNSSKDNRLKDIVSTIQEEQNKVIRADMWKPLIVQGAAGGGKTTIALHRIAYLLYNYENSFSPKNFMIIAPNRFFLSYISEVLPELGVEKVRQNTFEDFAMEIIGRKLKIKDTHEKLSLIISNPENKILIESSKFKTSLSYKNVIENYIKLIEDALMPLDDFRVSTFTIIEGKELRRLFLEEYNHLPMVKRLFEIKKHLVNTLKRKKPEIIESISFEADRLLEDARYEMKDSPERRKLISEITDNRDKLIEKVKKHSQTVVREYLSKFSPQSPVEYYMELIKNKTVFSSLTEKYISAELSESIRLLALDNLNENVFEFEDLAPIMYLSFAIYGLEDKLEVRHIIIDEAQDTGLFQLFILRKILNSSSFTILGDLCQGIHYYRGIEAWEDVIINIFKDTECSFLKLEQSYRTTMEIMEAASTVIETLNNPRLPAAKPVIRHGDPVSIVVKSSLEEIADNIISKLDDWKRDNYKSSAIICKTIEECLKLKALLGKYKSSVKVITGNEKDYSGGIVMAPCYLVKGLEFDMVIIANASEEMYSTDELDIKLLYVAMTRPLHKLHIFAHGNPSKALSKIL